MKIELDDKEIGKKILDSCINNNISIKDLGIKLNINIIKLNKYIKGDNRISLDDLIDICNYLNLKIDDLLAYKIKKN